MLHLSEFVWTLRSLVFVVFYNFLLIDATDRSKISSDQKRFFIALSLYPLSFFANTPFKACGIYILNHGKHYVFINLSKMTKHSSIYQNSCRIQSKIIIVHHAQVNWCLGRPFYFSILLWSNIVLIANFQNFDRML